MEHIRILTDSGADFPKPYPASLTVMPLTIRFGSEEYRDAVTIDHTTFFQKLAQNKTLPTTSLIPPAEFEAEFEKAAAAGETVIAILLSSKLSGTYQSAVLAAQDYPNVHVVDSLAATVSEQLLVRIALELADRGCSAAQIVEELEAKKSRLQLMGVPDTLEYLQKGGRISKTVAFVGGALSIKPILALNDGVVELIGKVRGGKNVDAYMIDRILSQGGIDFSLPFALGYTGSDAAMRRFLAASAPMWQGREVPIISVGATIGTHVGPNAVVVCYFTKE